MVAWQEFTEPDLPNKGKLLADDAALTKKLRALGVSAGKPVVVIADSRNGWGEDGRIVWTLRSLGHAQSYLVNGGVEALLADGPVTLATVTPGDFTVARTDDYAVTKEDLRAGLGSTDLVILDTREPREYAGETPYGESRGGHVPGAKPLFYKDLVGEDGKILQGDALKARLTDLGVGPTRRSCPIARAASGRASSRRCCAMPGSRRGTIPARCGNGRRHRPRTIPW